MTITTTPLPAQEDWSLDRQALPDFLVLFAAMHDAMRRDAARLERAIRDVAPEQPAVLALRAWWQRYADVIVHHHHREDELVWPALEARAPEFAAAQAPLHVDHDALDLAMSAVDTALAAMAARPEADEVRRGATDAAAAFRSLLLDHLRREESLAFPLLARTYTAEEYEALEQQMRKGSSLRQIAFEVPWVLDEAGPRVLALADEAVPAIMRALLRLSWTRRYRRVAGPVREVA
ncbi:hemerythrin domain-containing protein [Dermatobacter hominis]|uniref:hemerythrin domain-containing protein n=1 Tax=Dermatobacter hominis TaxID=2884263 RepID=UPI001D0FBDC1|nr:hemerythrin domain-containing protein [Dermatobacter hominis]UDY36733.1 hemerythrin domain-containing protein [Dermatobacter hominis]